METWVMKVVKLSLLGFCLGIYSASSYPALAIDSQPGSYYTMPGPQVPGFIPGEAIIAGPAPTTFTFTGNITVSTIGSYTLGTLNVSNPSGSSPPVIPIGSVITGTGVTAGTVVIVQTSPLTYSVVTTGGTVAAVSSETLTAAPKLTPVVQGTIQNTAPTYASGGCTAGGPAFQAGSNVFSWSFKNGTGTCTGGNTVTFTFPASTTSWACQASDTSNPTTDFYISTGAASTTAVVFTDYSSTGTAQNTKANAVVTGYCFPR